MVYYRFTNVESTVRTHCRWRGSVKNLTVLLLMQGVCPLPVKCLLFCFPVCPRPLQYCLSQIGQCTRDPAVRATDPSQSDGLIH